MNRIVILLLFISSFAFGQPTWSKEYSDISECKSIIQNEDETLVFTGNYSELTKINKYGDIIWSKSLFNGGNYRPSVLLKTNDGGYLIYGRNVIVKTDSLGNIKSQKFIEGKDVVSIITRGEGFLEVEYNHMNKLEFYSLSSTLDSTYLFNIIDDNIYPFDPPASTFLFNDVNGGISLAYQTMNNGVEGTNFVKLDSNYIVMWEKFQLATFNTGKMVHSVDGGYLFAWKLGGSGFNVSKYDSLAELLWTKNYESSDSTSFEVTNILNTKTNSILVSYTHTSIDGLYHNYDFGFSILNQTGNLIFSKIFDAGRSDFCLTSLCSNDGGYILGGQTNSFWPDYLYRAFIIKTDSLGNSQITSVNQIEHKTINDFNLLQNYPNPFNPTTIIEYQIPKNSFVNLIVYNLLGQIVAKLVNQNQISGKYLVKFDASNLPSGVYMYKLKANEFILTKKMILTK